MSISASRVDKRARLARALAREGFDDVYVIDHESAKEVLTNRRIELIDFLRGHDVASVRELAGGLERDKGAVSRDLKTLAEHDLIEFVVEDTKKRPVVKHETVVVEPVV